MDGPRIARAKSGELDLYVVSIPRQGRPPEGLTAAERAVYELLVRGDSNAEIAAARNSAVRTVANQVRAIYRKLGVRGRSALVRQAVIDSR
ncbi:MAG TPA: helix-turn-helix transcriptional regulator [Kofleriaceae bacterium]|nr:helix-turn-helix transcriptional regulator [Kofleriaceae bacterium]